MARKSATFRTFDPDSLGFWGARKKLNKVRQLRAEIRRGRIVIMLADIDLTARGWMRRLAKELGVSPSTVTRDLRTIFSQQRQHRERAAKQKIAIAERWYAMLDECLNPGHPRWYFRKHRKTKRAARRTPT